jgi:hypothetical protein
MNSTLWLAALLTTGMLSACMAPATNPSVVNVPLNATKHNVGHIARVSNDQYGVLHRRRTAVGTRPIRLYTLVYPGTCDHLGPSPAYAMNQTLNTHPVAKNRGWTLARSAPVPLGELRAGDYAIVVRTTPANGSLDIFRGDID